MKEKKEKNTSSKKKKIKKFFLVFFIVVFCISIVIALANVCVVKSNVKLAQNFKKVDYNGEQLVPQKDENGNWVFTTDGDFKVMHLTDIHLGGGFMCKQKDEYAMRAVANMIEAEKPDLVIATGDIAYPVPFQAGTFNNESGANEFIALMESLGVYWTVTFGNHDAEAYSYFDREAVSGFYSNTDLKYCLYQAGPQDVDGFGNHTIEIKNTKGIITQAFVMLDSQAYKDDTILSSIKGDYDNIHQNQVDWYKSEIQRMNAENKDVINQLQTDENDELNKNFGVVKTQCFFHIPLVEMQEAWYELEENNFKDTDSVKYIDGIIGETGIRVFPGKGEDNLFETMVELGSTKAIHNGHDHYNNAEFSRDGIIFSYGNSIDYLAYIGINKEGSQRGCSMIICKPDGTFEINKYNYYSDRYSDCDFEKEEVTMQFEDVQYQVPQKD